MPKMTVSRRGTRCTAFVATGRHRAVTDPAMPGGFRNRSLLGRAAPEDLLVYRPAELATLAAGAWAWLAQRQPGAPKIRFETPAATRSSRVLRAISVIEIVNDDMPFLVDTGDGRTHRARHRGPIWLRIRCSA